LFHGRIDSLPLYQPSKTPDSCKTPPNRGIYWVLLKPLIGNQGRHILIILSILLLSSLLFNQCTRTKQLGTSSSDGGSGVTTDSSVNVYVTGYTNGGLDGNTNSGEGDIFLVKYNSSGIKQ